MNVRVNASDKSEARGIQSIEVGAKLLNVLVDEEEPMMLKDLARLAGIAPAQAHAYLVSYRKLGLIEQEESAGRYRLGPFALELGITRMRTVDPMRMAREAVTDLSAKTGLNVALVVWGSFGPTVIQVQESGSQLNMNTRVGTVYSLTGTASGRAFAAFMPEGMIREAIRAERKDESGSGRVGKPKFLSRSEMEGIRAGGYATIDEPPVPGINALSAPVFDHIGQMQCAITAIGLDTVMSNAPDSEYIPILLETTRQLSFQLGYSGSKSIRKS
ncbi:MULTISPECIES: IclR family transcriptional regulator [Rhizobium/Agrobacterium group]|uniref:IclR family transcriptional regulator n=1 Tax=Rhizobium/Agrobacterium group TaxID=227290 RepID=UPI001ADC5334|nr:MULTISPECIES: IclR family transcriptional regulator [Rhizobium/Agrobacterium group]MBO9112643.1 IclR family transcriptional regulator [Agrobacterium sp. S2/73]QXZ76137.1 IclR family transcriptional regulator [Agrobacterium sp. S7/73]QYA17314.1 IclR family transcriptional regulator [Rhizobium sp. AB2/73]UEQ85569.1 IclR family transcriptional regulator [Rhizobium sp. AB2/73]